MTDTFKYDVCFSFAHEDRPYVEAVAKKVQSMNVNVFYDGYEEAELWGKNLYEHLSEIYSTDSRYCVIFISEHYARKLWTNHERKSAQARAFRESQEYILPARFDSTAIPGLEDTVGYVALNDKSPEEFADLIYKKVTSDSGSHPPDFIIDPPLAKTQFSKQIAVGAVTLILALLFGYYYWSSRVPADPCNSVDPPIRCILGR